MKAKTVIYKRVFNLGNYENESVSIELEVEEGETAQEVFDAAKEFVNLQHVESTDVMRHMRTIIDNPDDYTGKAVKDAKKYIEEHSAGRDLLPF